VAKGVKRDHSFEDENDDEDERAVHGKPRRF